MKNKSAIKRYLLALVVLFFINGSLLNAETITGSGCSVSNVGYLTELAKEYERQTGMKVFVRGGGSVMGIEDLRRGKVDFAASCRSREEGDPEDIQFIQVAWDALVFIVNKSNPLENISVNDALAIYSGRITNWQQLKGVNMPIKLIISRPQKGLSGVEASTKKLILGGKEPVVSSNTILVASTGLVEQLVEDTPEGFATTGVTSARKRNVKILKVNGVYPGKKNIIAGEYPFKRPLFVLIPGKPKPDVRKFIDFILSKGGQQFISALGVISLTDAK
ncbi:MAG: phosphate ABC transporter substrate-binding protein [Nitrospirae bacterium]|nr:phosphate ABC transporter substrate-binding protein [Nitrospirota bacterium]